MDLIYRQAAIDVLERKKDKNAKGDMGGFYNKIIQNDIDALMQLPSAEEESFEWCTDCKEYDQKAHCCHRWTKVIRNTVEEIKNEQRWIPVSEQLPEDEQEVLFSTKTGRVHQGKYHNDNSANQWYSSLDKMRAWNNVVNAWMPLPEPYKKDGD